MLLFAEWTPDQVTALVNAIMTGVLAIVGAWTAYLEAAGESRQRRKTDAQTETLKQQDLTLSHISQNRQGNPRRGRAIRR